MKGDFVCTITFEEGLTEGVAGHPRGAGPAPDSLTVPDVGLFVG